MQDFYFQLSIFVLKYRSWVLLPPLITKYFCKVQQSQLCTWVKVLSYIVSLQVIFMWLRHIPVGVFMLQWWYSCRKSKINFMCHHPPHSLCWCEHQQLQLLLGSLPRRWLFRRGRRRGWLPRWRGVQKRRGRKQLYRELGVKGQVQLLGWCQESTDCWLIRRPVASFPGEEEHI